MESAFSIELTQQEDYRFLVRFDNPAVPVLLTDETPPLGGGAGPSPSRLLAAAVANCLSASLLFALRKFHNDPGTLRTTACVTLGSIPCTVFSRCHRLDRVWKRPGGMPFSCWTLNTAAFGGVRNSSEPGSIRSMNQPPLRAHGHLPAHLRSTKGHRRVEWPFD